LAQATPRGHVGPVPLGVRCPPMAAGYPSSNDASPPAASLAAAASVPGPLAEAGKILKTMEDLEDYYFGADKGEKMKKASSDVTACVDKALAAPGAGKGQELRSRALFLKGRAASLTPGQEQSAEELLSKAIKLDPQYLQAWNALGEFYWNSQDMSQAQNCFEQALEMCGPNPVSLRNLSMVLRAMDDGADQSRRAGNYSKALAKAKEAVALGADDAQNWETLGNAYVGDFFVNGKRPDEIKRALIAYEKAEAISEKMGKRNPYLYFNRGMAAKYIEDYDLAIRSFQIAQQIGAAGAAEQVKKILEMVQRLAGQVEKKCDLKAKRLKELAADFPKDPASRTLAQLKASENAEVTFVVKVVSVVVDRKDETPAVLICCDGSGDFFALSIYNAELNKLAEAVQPMKTMLHIQSPRYKDIAVSGPKEQCWKYPCVVVGNPNDATIGGVCSLGSIAVRSVVTSRGAGLVAVGPAAEDTASLRSRCEAALIRSKANMRRASEQASKAGKGRSAIIEALVPELRTLVETELGGGAGDRLERVEAMFSFMGRGEVHQEDSEERGKRYAPGFIPGLEPNLPFHEEQAYPWCAELKRHFSEIRDELRSHLHESAVWEPGAYAQSNTSYAPDWRISGILCADLWQHPDRWKKTQEVIEGLEGVTPFEAFFARMPPHSTIASHSDNLNYILTSHLAIELESDMCSICVGKDERSWEEGQMLVFDTTYMHSAWNDSDRNRYVLVLRFWHPGLKPEERRAVHLSHALLAGTPDPERGRAKDATLFESPSEQQK